MGTPPGVATNSRLVETSANRDFVATLGGVPIGLSSNGIHVNLHLPVVTDRIDWTVVFPLEDFPGLAGAPSNISFGWGSREFYVNTPTWDEFELMTGIRALAGLGGTAVHVQYWPPLMDGDYFVSTTVSTAQYDRLVQHIFRSLDLGSSGRPQMIPDAGFGLLDRFYDGTGRYSPFVTCNEWVRQGLADAGIRTAVWSPFATALLDQWRGPGG